MARLDVGNMISRGEACREATHDQEGLEGVVFRYVPIRNNSVVSLVL
jgi:hypothetical protein